MALTGSLKEFGLADILQLIHYQHKTGVLNIQSRLDSVRLLFHEGNIVYAESKKRDIENRVGRMLLKRGAVNENDIRSAIEEQKKTGSRLGAVLIKRGLITREQLQEALTFQITETAVHLFSWKEGKYEFVPQGVPFDKETSVSISTQHLLMEGLRLLDEWSLIEGKITVDTVFERTGAEAGELAEDEAEVLSYVDGKTDVSGIADHSGKDSFQVSKALLQLAEKGVVATHEEERGPRPPAAPAIAPAAPPARRPQWLVPSAALLLSLALAAASLSFTGGRTDEFRASEQLSRLRFELEAVRAEKGAYPPSLPPSLTETDPWGNPYLYQAGEADYSLSSAGPDGRAGTEDDVF